MVVEYIEHINPSDSAAIEAAFASLTPQAIGCCNWPEEYPYTPNVTFRMFHSGEMLWLRFEVEEQYTKGEITEDNGKVWTDSCVEFFFAPDDESYYNFETTCTGRMLLGYHKTGEQAVRAEADVLKSILRFPSLGTAPFPERQGDNRWSMTLAIPAKALFGHKIEKWSGICAKANFYKCGDDLSHPHFLSWRPIENPKPNFHLPRFFDNIKFQ